MNRKKDIFTTGQVAEICNVAPRTVTKWFDSGQLKGYRIPGSRDRRIPAVELLRFMKAHNIPADELGEQLDITRILIIDSDRNFARDLGNAISKLNSRLQIETAAGGFEAGIWASRQIPHVILINLMAHNIDAADICRNVRANKDLQATKIIALADGLGENEAVKLSQKGYDGYVTNMGDPGQINQAIEQATAIIY